jgi:DNA-binding MarR family transcriptional regulator
MSMTPRVLITELILEAFRLNGCLLASGDALVADLGLTTARWQALGMVAASAPLPVAHISRNMGLTRQAVQRLINEMAADGLVRFAPNPHHARARLVLLTPRGKAAYDAAMQRQRPWAENLAAGLDPKAIAAATATLRALRGRLEQETKAPSA